MKFFKCKKQNHTTVCDKRLVDRELAHTKESQILI